MWQRASRAVSSVTGKQRNAERIPGAIAPWSNIEARARVLGWQQPETGGTHEQARDGAHWSAVIFLGVRRACGTLARAAPRRQVPGGRRTGGQVARAGQGPPRPARTARGPVR